MTATGWTDEVARFVVRTPTDEVRRLADPPIVDTIGVLVAGVASEAGQAVRRYLGAPATLSGVFGGARAGADAEARAMAGATIGHALDFDDVSDPGHPSSIVLATILAAPITGRLSGERLMDAYVVGYEVSVKVSRALGPAHYRVGWHTTCTGGSFGAAAAAARLFGLDESRTRIALGIVASLVGGLQRNFGTMTKPLHSGFAARNGLLAVQLAAAGLTAAEDVLDGARGFFDLYGAGEADPSLLGTLGRPWAMRQRPPLLKKYPSCYSTHRPIEAVLAIQRAHRIAIDELDGIAVHAPPLALLPLVHSSPRTGLEAKFSAEYCLAAAFADRGITLASFSDDAVWRDDVRRLMGRIEVREDPRCRPDDPEGRRSRPGSGGFWEVVVRRRDGRREAATVEFAPGTPENPLGWADIEAKFQDCLRAGGCDPARGRAVYERLRQVEREPDVPALLAELTP